MFAGQYFAQLVFAGELFIPAPPPPPPPPPEPVVYCDRYAIGRCIGTADTRGGLVPVGQSSQVCDTRPAIGTAGRPQVVYIGTAGGPICP